MKIRRTGIILLCINTMLIAVLVLGEYAVLAKGNTSGGWSLVFPIFWNFPIAALLIPLVSLKIPEWGLTMGLIILGGIQWYFIGHGIEALVSRIRNRSNK